MQTLDHPARRSLSCSAARSAWAQPCPPGPAPKLGQDTDALLEELGYDQAEIQALRAKGVI